MAKKRSKIKDIISKAIYSDKKETYTITYIDRTNDYGIRLLQITTDEVFAVSNWAITLNDNETVIPIHRIVEIKDNDGKILWKKGVK
ncbi:hypothetical protein Calag_0801 [Caldisphaera lagunensis DSM 15908]|uniref:UPF0248 protein Calag_0801 n=1 Tax=Caldisphaera lagunensis (strain DSM 15908 / JCM 11604 / ANMR 0165 / IC-154) TaxID=1056495 RepID=L0ABP0_CALLD|nr:RNA repair domain-containing protein [Caldisphaera lagunensis]AFZ70542.1 hypothetical protein Calag_0801 [Caldisphaera lagunensis DSM 15908]